MNDPALANWYAAYIVAAIVITVLVAVLAIALYLCRRIGERTLDIAESLDALRGTTEPLRRMPAIAGELDEAARSLARIRHEQGQR